MRVLVVEDERVFAETLVSLLKREKYDAEIAPTARDAMELLEAYEYNLVLLDLGLPDLDGIEVLKKIRNSGKTTPVLILSGFTETNKKVEVLSTGADDYITKPFDKEELFARIKSSLRRASGFSENTIVVGSFVLNIGTREVEIDKKKVPLTKKEYDLLELLALNKGRVVTKEKIIDSLYGGNDSPDMKIIDVFICKLRKKLSKISKTNYITTSWGVGYSIKDEK